MSFFFVMYLKTGKIDGEKYTGSSSEFKISK